MTTANKTSDIKLTTEDSRLVAILDEKRAELFPSLTREQRDQFHAMVAKTDKFDADQSDALAALISNRFLMNAVGIKIANETEVDIRQKFANCIEARCDQGSMHSLILRLADFDKLAEYGKLFNLCNCSAFRQKLEGKEGDIEALGWAMPEPSEKKKTAKVAVDPAALFGL